MLESSMVFECELCKAQSEPTRFDGVLLTIVCSRCAGNHPNNEGKSLVCASRAVTEFGTTKSDLDHLHSKSVRNPHYRSAAPMKMFSRAEVKVKADQREHLMRLKLSKLEESKRLRIDRLRLCHKITSENVSESLKETVFGDYLEKFRPKTTLERVKKMHSLVDLAESICQSDPAAALRFCENRDIDPHKTSPQEVANTFYYNADLLSRVVENEFVNISRFLSKSDITGVSTLGTLGRIPKLLLDYESKSMDRLEHALRSRGIDDPKKILALKCLRDRVSTYKRYGSDADETADKIKHFLEGKLDSKSRKNQLSLAMSEMDMEIRSDSVYCRQYIDGHIDVDLDEIVGIQALTRHLFDNGGYQAYSDLSDDINDEFRKLFFYEGKKMRESVELAKKRVRIVKKYNCKSNYRSYRGRHYDDY